VFILGSWPDSGRNTGREGLITGRTFRAALDKRFPVAFCRTKPTKKGLKRGEGEFLDSRGHFAGFRVKLGAYWYPPMRSKKTHTFTRNFWYADVLHMLWGVTTPPSRFNSPVCQPTGDRRMFENKVGHYVQRYHTALRPVLNRTQYLSPITALKTKWNKHKQTTFKNSSFIDNCQSIPKIQTI
jgi:hypothetical protein